MTALMSADDDDGAMSLFEKFGAGHRRAHRGAARRCRRCGFGSGVRTYAAYVAGVVFPYTGRSSERSSL